MREGWELTSDAQGLIPAIVQNALTGDVLMLGYMNREALEATLDTGFVHFYSRSRQRLWRKGETSGNGLKLRGIMADCDGDCLLVLAVPQGPTCHTGEPSCFHKPLAGEPWQESPALPGLLKVVHSRRKKAPEGSYTGKLLLRPDEALKKLVEEAAEVMLAAKAEGGQRLVEELADLLYHLAVVLVSQNVSISAINEELKRRGLGAKP